MLKEKYTEEEFRKKPGRIADATLGKLPPLWGDGRNTSQRSFRLQLVKPDFQQEYMEERERKIMTIYEQQQQNALEKVRKMSQHKNPSQRQYHSARDRYDRVHHDEQDYNATERKTSGTDKPFAIKSVNHKRAYSLSNIYRPNIEHIEPLEAERLPHNLPVQSRDYPDRYGGRSDRRGSERQLPENQVPVIPMPSSFGEVSTRYRGRVRGSQWQEGRLEEDRMRLEEQIRRKEIVLQEKLRRVVEELGKVRREKCTSAGILERRERIEIGSERGKWENEKERRESEKTAYVEQERAKERKEREKDKQRERQTREHDRESERRERERERERIKEEEWEREKWGREKAKASELERGRREWEQERRERVLDRTQRRWTQEKHCKVLQRDSERNSCISNRSIPPEVSQRRPTHVTDETPGQLEVERISDRRSEAVLQRLPCSLCHRNFAADRLEKHLKVCEKAQHSTRKVFDSSKYRAKGTDLEEYMKTNTRTKTPELKKSNWRQKHKAFIHNLQQARMPTKGGPQLHMEDYQTCPHCARRFAPGPAERHVPLCQNIRSRPPPPRRHLK
ncbi:zinc finger C2HC domain-containing protein 1C [Conger conger]|uniref:zinc finger C2HC domain-containing protein 1C n=1 Tax=Conger conger TaxID=82655 RepID=UPI002A5AD7D3|nr:zinc finger C2HC domain-containing protein 1C [Conger conger]